MKWNKNAASQKGRVFRSGLLSTAMLAAVLVLAVLLNLLVRAIPAKYTEFDLSEAKMYTLSDSTKALVEGLEKDVHIYYLCETGSEDAIITKLLDHYAAESGHLSWEQKDPTLYPTFAAKYGAENVSTGSLIVTCGENSTVRALRDKLEQGILSQISHCFPTGDVANRLPNTSNIAFEYIEGEAILLLLNKLGIAASSGSACTSGSLEPSHVMRAMGIPYTAAHGTIRFSLSVYNTEDEVDRVIAAVPPIIEQLRKLSPYWGEKGPSANPEASFAPTYA